MRWIAHPPPPHRPHPDPRDVARRQTSTHRRPAQTLMRRSNRDRVPPAFRRRAGPSSGRSGRIEAGTWMSEQPDADGVERCGIRARGGAGQFGFERSAERGRRRKRSRRAHPARAAPCVSVESWGARTRHRDRVSSPASAGFLTPTRKDATANASSRGVSPAARPVSLKNSSRPRLRRTPRRARTSRPAFPSDRSSGPRRASACC